MRLQFLVGDTFPVCGDAIVHHSMHHSRTLPGVSHP